METQTAGDEVTLELDDIQSGALHERPSPYVGTYLLLRIDDRDGGPRAGPAAARRGRLRSDLGRAGRGRVGHRGVHLPGPEGAGRAAGVPGQLRAGVQGGDGGAGRRARRRRREQPGELGEAARHAGRPRRPGRAVAGRGSAGRGRRARTRTQEELAGVEVDLAPGLLPAARPDGRRSASRTGSASPRSREAASRARTRASRRSRPARSCSATPTRPASLPPMPTPEVLGRNGTYVVFRKLHTRVAAYRQYLREKAAEPRGGGAARRQDGRALAERSAARARARRGRSRARRRPESQQRLRLRATICAASSARPAPTPAAPTRAMHSTTRGASTSGCTG